MKAKKEAKQTKRKGTACYKRSQGSVLSKKSSVKTQRSVKTQKRAQCTSSGKHAARESSTRRSRAGTGRSAAGAPATTRSPSRGSARRAPSATRPKSSSSKPGMGASPAATAPGQSTTTSSAGALPKEWPAVLPADEPGIAQVGDRVIFWKLTAAFEKHQATMNAFARDGLLGMRETPQTAGDLVDVWFGGGRKAARAFLSAIQTEVLKDEKGRPIVHDFIGNLYGDDFKAEMG